MSLKTELVISPTKHAALIKFAGNFQVQTRLLTTSQPDGLNAGLAWARSFVLFICLWLLLGDLIGVTASNYTANVARIAAFDKAANASANPNQTALAGFVPKIAPTQAEAQGQLTNPTASDKARTTFNQLSLSFEANQGQADSSVKYLAHGTAYNVYLGEGGTVLLDLATPTPNKDAWGASGPPVKSSMVSSSSATGKSFSTLASTLPKKAQAQATTDPNVGAEGQLARSDKRLTLAFNLVGASPTAPTQAHEQLKTKVNYSSLSSTNSQKNALTNITTYGQIQYKDVYPGIDLNYYSKESHRLEYDFMVAPQAEPDVIALDFGETTRLELASDGSALIHVGAAQLVSTAPVIYQVLADGSHKDVKGSYILKNNHQLGFKLEKYDHAQPLVIDPTILYASFFNGSDYDTLNAVTVDQQGNVYATGASLSIDLGQKVAGGNPVSASLTNVFFIKIDHDFTTLTFNYLLGPDGAPSWRDEGGNAIAVDSAGHVFIGGYTYSYCLFNGQACTREPFPITSSTNAYQCNLNNAVYSAITQNPPPPDGFVTEFDTNLSTILYSSYFGGSATDVITGLAVDPTGQYVTIGGYTSSTDLPVTPNVTTTMKTYQGGNYEGFVARLDTHATSHCARDSAVYVGYLGGSGDDFVYDLKTDSAGNTYLTGMTQSSNFPTNGTVTALQAAAPAGESGFFTKLSADGSTLLYSSYLGGDFGTDGYSIALDGDNNVYIGGTVYSTDSGSVKFPLKNAYQTQVSNNLDGFLTVISPTLPFTNSLLYSTYLGGSGGDEAVWGVALNGDNNVFLTGYTTSFTNTNVLITQTFPLRNELEVTPGSTNSGKGGDAFFAHFNTAAAGDASLLDATYLGGSNLEFGAAIAVDRVSNIYLVGYTYSADFPDINGSSFYNSGGIVPPDAPPCDGRVVPQRKDPYFNPPYSQCHSQDGFFVRLTLAQTLPLGGCDGGAIRATQFVPVAYSSEQLNCQEVDPNDGNYAASVTDLSLSPPPEAADLAINFGRHYNSQDPTAGALGVGWRYSYEWNLEEVDGVVTITTPTGRKDVYPFKEIGFDLAATNKYGDGSLVKDISGAFKLTTLDKTVYKFVFGKLVSINDRNNNQLNFTYTGGLLSQIDLCLAVPCGTPVQTLVVQNDGNGHLAGLSVGGVYSRTVTYSYTNGLLTDVKDVRDHHTTFSYYIGAPHQNLLQSATDPKGHRLIYLNYDNANRVSSALASFTTATGTDHPTAFDYSQAGQTTVTDARGNPAIYYYKGGNKPTNPLRTTQVLDAEGYQHTFNYDDAFHIKSQTDGNGQTTFYTYNSQGVLETISHTVTVNGVVQTYTTTTHYNSQNQATDVTDSRGFVTRITYDSGGNNIKTVTDPVSNTVTYDYYSGGRVKSVTTASNGTNKLVVNYLYDSAGFPQHVTRAFSTLVPPATTPSPVTIQVDYTYNAPDGRLLTQTDAYYTAAGAAPAVTYDYDKAGHIISFNNQKSQLSTWHYDDAGNLDTIVNYLGQQTTSTYNEINLPLDVSQQLVSTTLTTHYDYDDNANLKQITDPKLVATQYGYDKLNRQTSASLSVSAGTAQTLTQYDGVGNVIRITRANLGVNGGNQVTTYGYDELNRLITTTLGVGVFDYQVINSYDPASNLIGVKRTGVGNGADTNQITLATASYDALNRPLASTVYPGVTSPLTTTYSYNDPANAYTVTNPDGIVTTYQADNNDRLIQMTTTPFAGAVITASPQTAYLAYNATGQVIHAVDPSGNWTDTTYDELHRVKTNTQYPQPLGQGTPLTTQIIYTDQTQPKITVSGPAHTGGNLTQVLQYDSVGRLLSMNDGVLNTAYQYDQQGNLFKEIDPLKTTTYTYENTGWLKTVSQQVTGPSGLQTLTTAYNYDLVGNRISTTDANSHSISATYDVLNRLVGTQDALSNTTSRVYDGLSRLLSYQDGKRQTTNFTYDNISRLVQIASVGNLLTTFNYSGNQLASMQDKLGTNPATTTTYTYDGLDRLGAVSSLQGVVQYGYDSSNRRTALKFGPDTAHLQTVGYQYDAYDRLTAITGWQGQLSYGYDGERLSTLTYPNGVNASFSYDVANRLTDLSYKNGPATIYSAHYDLDPLSQPVTLTESLNGTSRLSTYSYDELSRLRVETTQLGRAAVLTSTYTYDKVGNRTQLVAGQPNGTTVTSLYGYDAADRLITTTAKASNARVGSSTTYGYDANNSLTSEIFSGPGGSGGYRTQYSYDTRNRLTGWQQQQSGTSVVSNMAFGYDGNNTRISLANNGQLTSYLQDAAGGGGLPVVLQEATTGAAGPASYLYPVGSTSPIMQTDTGGNTSWYHLDNTGSVRFMTDGGSGSPGAIKTAYTYNAFGQTISQTATVSNTHTYAGEQLDPTGLYYDRARFYNPATGRFITQDTFDGSSMLPPTQNRYVYAGNTPTTFTDPSGHCFVICAIVGAVVGAVFSYGSQVINNLGQGKGWNSFTDINWGRVLIGAGAGAVAGATAGLASGAIGWAFGADAVSSWGAAAVSGAVGQVAYGQSERAITNVLAGRNVLDGLFQVDDILGDAALGAVFGVGFKAVASAWSSWRGRIGVGEGNEGGVSGPVTPDDNTPRQLTSGIRPRLEEPSRLIKPSDLEGLTVRQVNRKLKAIGATVDRANDGGPRWRWTEDGVQFEVRYHLHANPLFRTGPSGFGKTIKYGKVIVGNGSPITPEELTNFDILLQARLGPALDNQISSGFTGVPTDWLDPFGVIYFTADNVLGGRFSNATHILGEGNPWRPGMVGSERRVIYL